MILQNAKSAVVEIKKLEEYCLNPAHPRGKHKAKVFNSVLGLKKSDSKLLQSKLKEIVVNFDSVQIAEDNYGTRYFIDFNMQIEKKKASVRSIWIIKSNEDFPRFVTCYIK